MAGHSTRPLPAPLPRYGSGFTTGSAGATGSSAGVGHTATGAPGGPTLTASRGRTAIDFPAPQPTFDPPAQPPSRPQLQPWTPAVPPASLPVQQPGGTYGAASTVGGFGAPTGAGMSMQPPFQRPHQPSFPTVSAITPPAVSAITPPAQQLVSTPPKDTRPGYERSWSELTAEQQAACRVLGYDRSKWDEERSELAASRMMADERDAEEQRRAQEMADSTAAASAAARTSQSAAASTLLHQGGGSTLGSTQTSPAKAATPSAGTDDALFPAFKVAMIDTELDAETNKVFYVMDVQRSADAAAARAGTPQRVRKRYSEFEALRKELAAHSKAAKALEFPKKQRIKGRRGGRDEQTVDARSRELETWLNSAITTCAGDLGGEHSDVGWCWQEVIEAWFQEETKTAAGDARASATLSAEQEEEAELMAAIQASLGEAGGSTSSYSEGVPPGAGSSSSVADNSSGGSRMTSLTQMVSVDNLPATIEAIEMGFAPERVKRLQSERQQSTGSPYQSTQELLEAVMSAPE
eukprot:COSAG02_NODE_3285_length_7007_cov_4.103503_2_plen_523_part_00